MSGTKLVTFRLIRKGGPFTTNKKTEVIYSAAARQTWPIPDLINKSIISIFMNPTPAPIFGRQ